MWDIGCYKAFVLTFNISLKNEMLAVTSSFVLLNATIRLSLNVKRVWKYFNLQNTKSKSLFPQPDFVLLLKHVYPATRMWTVLEHSCPI